jgi:hypothetical protein
MTKTWRRELTGGGRSHPCDLQWIEEELADDAKTWVNRSAMKWRSTICEESPNGRAKRRLAGDERRGVLTSVMEKNGEWGGSFGRPTVFIAEGENW